MREANWDEIFQRRDYDDAPPGGDRLSAVVPWEDWLTFLLTAVAFMSVVTSINNAHWVSDMPSLYPIGFSALVIGYALSRLRWNALLLHPIALFLGATLVFLQLMAVVSGPSLYVRTDHLLDRMYAWWSAVTQDGISNDQLPFIVLMLVLTWLGAYLSAWAIFRWRNPVLGLVPGGAALMWNISFIPGQFSFSFVVFLFAAVLLVMRLHVARRETQWDSDGVAYPEFISLSALNATFWATCALLVAVWLMPLHARSDTAYERWDDFTAPLTRHLTPLSRVFVSVNAKKPVNIHNLKDALPFQGKINLSGKDAVRIDVKITPEMAAFLREQSFDEYTRDGWKVNVTSDVPLPPGFQTLVDEDIFTNSQGSADGQPVPPTRQDVTINVKVEGGNNDHLFSLGQPLTSDQPATASVGADLPDISSLKPAEHLSNGDEYSVTGSVSVASIDQLRAAGTEYPSWVTRSYLELPRSLPRRVRFKAREVTRGSGNPYDDAAAIEQYLRTFPNDYDVPAAPPGQDPVDYFLFDAQRGYFDYHASAMAVMLRAIGIPARVATGYVVDPLQRQGDSDTFKLTQRQAFAWPEVYFPGIGWVEFSPAPTQPLIDRPGTVKPASGPGSKKQGADPEAPIDLGISSGAPAAAQPAAAKRDGGSSTWPLVALASMAAAALALAAAGKLAWEFGLGGLPRPAQLWEKTIRLATLGRARPHDHETPREFAARLRRDVPGAGGVAYIASAYERSRFGQKPLSGDEAERLEAAWSSARAGLLRRALRLKPRRPETL
jgi:transglutaminase-like putative cysteine protease